MQAENCGAFAIYTNKLQLEEAVKQLKRRGFSEKEVSVIMPNSAVESGVKAAEVGAGSGAVVGGVLGWLAGAGLLAIPGIGALVVLGPIGTALLGAATLGGVGGIFGSFVGLELSDEEAREYEERLKKGDMLLLLHCEESNRLVMANRILQETGADTIRLRAA